MSLSLSLPLSLSPDCVIIRARVAETAETSETYTMQTGPTTSATRL